MKKLILIFFVCTIPLLLFSQFLPINLTDWEKTYWDEFDGTINDINDNWEIMTGTYSFWETTDQTYSTNSKYISCNTSGSKKYIEFKAFVENVGGVLTNYSGGIIIRAKIWNGSATIQNPDNPFYYGYYEIESKLTKGNQSMSNIGLWPAFWFQHSESDAILSKYWSEEVDIFEPGACQVKDDSTTFHYWTINDENYPMDSVNTWRGNGHEGVFGNADMFNWHRWGVLWLPDHLVFYYDGVPIHSCTERVPSHDRPQLFINLEIDKNCACPKINPGQFIGSFQINYFRYYALPECNAPITETMGTNYNFSNWSNDISNAKQYCIFKNTSIPSNSHIIVRPGEYAKLKGTFTVPKGATFEIIPKPCQ